MEKNTVTMSLGEYNKLSDFYDNARKKAICVELWINGYVSMTYYYTKDELIKQLASEADKRNNERTSTLEILSTNRELSKELSDAYTQIQELEKKLSKKWWK